jgi:hypothetical protein
MKLHTSSSDLLYVQSPRSFCETIIEIGIEFSSTASPGSDIDVVKIQVKDPTMTKL